MSFHCLAATWKAGISYKSACLEYQLYRRINSLEEQRDRLRVSHLKTSYGTALTPPPAVTSNLRMLVSLPFRLLQIHPGLLSMFYVLPVKDTGTSYSFHS